MKHLALIILVGLSVGMGPPPCWEHRHEAGHVPHGPPVTTDTERPDVLDHTAAELIIEEPWWVFVDPAGEFAVVITDDDLYWLNGIGVECVNVALQACGEGGICWIRIRRSRDGVETCEFACRDADGHCTPMPRDVDVRR